MRLSDNQRDQYRETGLAFPIRVLSQAEASGHLASYRATDRATGGAGKAAQMPQVHRFFDWAWELSTDPRVLDAVESVIGPDILLWSASVFPKLPLDPGHVTMHQDGTYWGLEGGAVTTAWIALTESTVANGCMRVVPGSHRLQIQPHKDTYGADNLLTRGQVVQVEYDESEVVDVELEPGEMSLHHVRAIHGSRCNGTEYARVGFAARYVTPDARPTLPGQTAALVRGSDSPGNWDMVEGPPGFGSLASAARAHRREAEKFVATLTDK